MANSTKKIALLAAGYLLGKSKSKGLKSVLLIASGVAAGRMTASQGQDDESNESMVSKFSNSAELQRVTSGLAEAARGAFSATASKGLETLNENLQNRTAALRDDDESDDEQDSGAENASETDEAESQEAEASEAAEDSEDSEEASADDAEATESGGR